MLAIVISHSIFLRELKSEDKEGQAVEKPRSISEKKGAVENAKEKKSKVKLQVFHFTVISQPEGTKENFQRMGNTSKWWFTEVRNRIQNLNTCKG